MAMTGRNLVFWIDGRLGEDWSHMEVQLYD